MEGRGGGEVRNCSNDLAFETDTHRVVQVPAADQIPEHLHLNVPLKTIIRIVELLTATSSRPRDYSPTGNPSMQALSLLHSRSISLCLKCTLMKLSLH
jgi:hypothetical protein